MGSNPTPSADTSENAPLTCLSADKQVSGAFVLRKRVRLYAPSGGRVRVAVANTRSSFLLAHVLRVGRARGLVDAALCLVLLPGDAFGVYPKQDIDAMTCPFGHLSGGHACVEPRRDGSVPKVVGPRQEPGGYL